MAKAQGGGESQRREPPRKGGAENVLVQREKTSAKRGSAIEKKKKRDLNVERRQKSATDLRIPHTPIPVHGKKGGIGYRALSSGKKVFVTREAFKKEKRS